VVERHRLHVAPGTMTCKTGEPWWLEIIHTWTNKLRLPKGMSLGTRGGAAGGVDPTAPPVTGGNADCGAIGGVPAAVPSISISGSGSLTGRSGAGGVAADITRLARVRGGQRGSALE